MQIKMKNGYVYIKEADARQVNAIKPYMKWDKKEQLWVGVVTLDFLEKLSKVIILPEVIKAEYDRLKAVQDAVDNERTKPDKEVKPLAYYPVKKKLYTHQIRASNMALINFGLIKPKEGRE